MFRCEVSWPARAHVGGDIGVPRGTRRFVWRVVLASRRGEVVVEGAFGSGHPVRWVDPVSGVGRARSSGQPEGRGSTDVWSCLMWRLVARGSSGGIRVTSDVHGGRTAVRSVICGVLGGCGFGRGRRCRDLRQSANSQGLSAVGWSGLRFQNIAVSMLGVSRSWQHGGGSERQLLRRTSRSSNHTG